MKFIVSIKNPNNSPLSLYGAQVTDLKLTFDTDAEGAASVVRKIDSELESIDDSISRWLERVYQGETAFENDDENGTHIYRHPSGICIAWYFD